VGTTFKNRSPLKETNMKLPPELQTMLDAHKLHPEAPLAKGTRGRVIGKLNEYAGGDERRHAFLAAAFTATTTRDLRDWELAALDGWLDHPKAREDVNALIAEYLTSNNMADLPRTEKTQRVGTKSTVGKSYQGAPDVIYDMVLTQNPGRLMKGSDYRIPIDIVSACGEQAMEMNRLYPDAIIVASFAVVLDPNKQKDILKDIGGLARGD